MARATSVEGLHGVSNIVRRRGRSDGPSVGCQSAMQSASLTSQRETLWYTPYDVWRPFRESTWR